MANADHLDALLSGKDEWAAWRRKNYRIRPDVSGADLSKQNFDRFNLREVDFSDCNLSGAYFPRADLYGATLSRANLSRIDAVHTSFTSCNAQKAHFDKALLLSASFLSAKLDGASFAGASMSQVDLSSASMQSADLSDADLLSANLMDADLRNATLIRTNLNLASLLRADLRGATLFQCQVHGASAWRVSTDASTKQAALSINDPSEAKIEVDDFEIAQFVYMLLNHQKLRSAIHAVAERGVLILGKFSDGGIDTLRSIAEGLRDATYLPFLFDFAPLADRNYTETALVMAGLSRFIVVDLSGPSVPQELMAIVPHVKVPVVPIIHSDQKEYSLFPDILEYSWVVRPILRFSSNEHLRTQLVPRAVRLAERKVVARRKRLLKARDA